MSNDDIEEYLDTIRSVAELRDSVDRLIAEWNAEDPTLPVDTLGIVQRIRRVNAHLESALEANFAAHELTGTGFGVLSVLIRRGSPHEASQRDLTDLLGLSAGTISLRIDKLEEQGLVSRRPDPADGRSTLVRLLPEGRLRFDATAPVHLALQERLLSTLSREESETLADLLRRLLAAFEKPASPAVDHAGLSVVPSHEARELQRRLGAEERSGLLVTAVTAGSTAERARLHEGDLIVSVDGRPLRSIVDLDLALGRSGLVQLGVRRDGRIAHLDLSAE